MNRLNNINEIKKFNTPYNHWINVLAEKDIEQPGYMAHKTNYAKIEKVILEPFPICAVVSPDLELIASYAPDRINNKLHDSIFSPLNIERAVQNYNQMILKISKLNVNNNKFHVYVPHAKKWTKLNYDGFVTALNGIGMVMAIKVVSSKNEVVFSFHFPGLKGSDRIEHSFGELLSAIVGGEVLDENISLLGDLF